MLRLAFLFLLISNGLLSNSADAQCVRKGDQVFMVFGKTELLNLIIERGEVIEAGNRISRVKWRSCSGCGEWVRSCALHHRAEDVNADLKKQAEAGSGRIVGGIVKGFVELLRSCMEKDSDC